MEKIGRNDPCPCGSGKKYKQCCLSREASGTAAQPLPAQQKHKATLTSAQLNELTVLFNAARYADMENVAGVLLEQYPESGLAWKALGTALRAQRKEALPALRKAAELLPGDPEAHNNLGITLQAAGRPADAAIALRHALQLNVNFAEAHGNLGNALRDLGQYDDAIASYRRALQIRPDFVAHGNLGIALNQQGYLDEAATSFDAAISLKPDYIGAHYGLSQLKTYRENDPHVAMLEQQLERAAALPMDVRIRYWFTLGKVREDLGRYDESFAAYREGNRLKSILLKPNEASEDALLQGITAIFTKEFFAERAGSGFSGKTPIFIVGMPRSGTSLLEQILATYPDLHGAGELSDLSDIAEQAFRGPAAKPFPYAVPDLSADTLRRMGEQYAERIWKLAPEATYITDKMPANLFYLGLIRLMLPNAKIIHAMRDPMDSCFSCYSRLFVDDSQPFSYDLEALGRHYGRYAKLMRHWHAVLPTGTILDCRYEDMVTDTEGQARRLLEYLGLPWDDRCLDFHRNRRRVATASAAQVRKPIYQTSMARWERFRRHLDPLFNLVQEYRP